MSMLTAASTAIVVVCAHILLKCGGFERLYTALAALPALGRTKRSCDASLTDTLRRQVDWVCRRLCRESYCLQRAAALTVLLRLRGVEAVMVVGVRRPPFEGHAWTEVDDVVVSESADAVAGFQVIRRLAPASTARERRVPESIERPNI